MATNGDLGQVIDDATAALTRLTTENMRLRHLLTVVANMGLDPEDAGAEEWCFCEDAAQFVKDNL